MLRKRLLLYLAFAAYQIISFVFTVMVDGHLDLLGLLKYIPLFKYISFLGLALFVVDFVWFWMDRQTNRRAQRDLETENTELKAKIYDFQEAAKTDDSIKKA